MIPNLTGNLSSVMNLVPTPGAMTIIPLLDTTPIPVPAGLPYVVMFNPESYDEQVTYVFDDRQPSGNTESNQPFDRARPGVFSFEFLIDGTGASGDKREVIAEVLLFKSLMAVNSIMHRPPYLLLIWGTFVETCICQDIQITYTLFRSNGTPLRAKIKATFRKQTSRILELAKLNLMSPDLTHLRQVREGDNLPNLCQTIYDSNRFYLEVARVNKLTSFRPLKRGRELKFPPVEK